MRPERTAEKAVDLEKETWKPVKNYQGVYFVSNNGRVKSIDRYISCHKKYKRKILGRILKIQRNPINNYEYILLRVNGKVYLNLIHRLVARAFIGICPPKHQVNHKDLNKSNNKSYNLEYLTAKENMHHMFKNKTINYQRGEDRKNSKLTNKKVIKIRKEYKLGNKTQEKIANFYGIALSTCNEVIHRKKWKHIE